jgi:hypothetical protein
MMRLGKVKVRWVMFTLCLILAGATMMACEASNKEVPRITIEELKAKLGSPGVVVIDVRADQDWTASDQKIKGAVREDPKKVDAWTGNYPKDKTIILYCA